MVSPMIWRALALALFIGAVSCADQATVMRGVNVEEATRYTLGSDKFQCRDGGKEIAWEQVNDDYCDCADGSDEPGTSACSNGFFWCRNQGFKSQIISSTFVNDGVCDCCDGTDEFNGMISCVNDCADKGAAIKQDLQNQLAIHTQGAHLRQELAQAAQQVFGEKRARMEQAKQELESAKVARDEAAAAKAPVEETVNNLRAERKAAKEARDNAYNAALDAAKEAEKAKQIAEGVAEDAVDTSAVTVPREEEPETPKTEEETRLEELETTFNAHEGAVKKLEGEISEIEGYLNTDFGPDNAFATLKGQCFSAHIRNYDYEICLFDTAKQKDGHQHTSTGTFERWDNDRSVMHYGNGQRCWQGPNRQTRVNLECGLENKVLTVAEPETCKYEVQFSSPVACSMDHANVVRMELENM